MAMVMCCATFPLIWVGGLVTSHDAGMAVPDWPSTYGYNLFLYPWKTWFFGPFDVFVEHGHRLLGAAVGLITIGFLLSIFLCDRRLWMRFAAIAALSLVIAQGVIGGGRVELNAPALAQLHGCVGPLFFALTASLAVMTSRLWREHRRSESPASEPRLVRLGWISVALLFGQIVLGSFLRHGSRWAAPEHFRMWLMFHLLMAFVVAGHLLWWSMRAARHGEFGRMFFRPAISLAIMILLQMCLGGATWVVNYGWPVWMHWLDFAAGYRIQAQGMLQSTIVTGHVAVGSLLLATATALATRQSRLLAGGSKERVNSRPRQTLQGVLA